MIFSDSLEVAIGLTFVFLLLSLVLTAVNEIIETVVKSRAQQLFAGITALLSDPASTSAGIRGAETIYGHPLIRGLMRGDVETAQHRKLLPSYLPSRNFALALIDQAMGGKFSPEVTNATLPITASSLDRLRLAAERIDNEQVRRVLLQAVEAGNGDIERARAHLEEWYNSAMDRVSGWYKRRTQRIIFVLGLVLAVALNVNTLTLADSLSKNATLRRAVVAQAEKIEMNKSVALGAQDAMAEIDKTGMSIGWNDAALQALRKPIEAKTGLWRLGFGWLQIVLGFLITALAVTLGAPFWFDVLNRLMVIRATVKPTEKSPDEASQDSPGKKAAASPVAGQAAVALPTADSNAMDTDIYAIPPSATERLFEGEDQEPVRGASALGEAA